MKAVVMTAPGGPEVLHVQQLPEPALPSGSELLVRLKAAGINPIDTKLRARGTFDPDQRPAILGCDGAGTVEAVGPGVRQFHVGDEVYFCNGGLGYHPGTYTEFALVDERFVARKPKTLNFAEAAAVPLVSITAWEALFDRGRLQAGQQVMVHAGAGGVGHVAIQLAKHAGATVITTVSSDEKAQFAMSLGAASTIDYRNTDAIAQVYAWTRNHSGEEGVDLCFDTVGREVLSQSFAMTRIYGDVVTLLAPDATTDWKTARDRNLRVSYELMLTPMLKHLVTAQAAQAQILYQCAQLVDQGQLKIHVNRVFPLEQAAEAHRLLEQGGMVGKLVLTID